MTWIFLFKLPGRALAALSELLARRAYRAYGATTGFKNYQGLPMPEWPALPETIRAAWRAAARAIFLLGLASGLLLGGVGGFACASFTRSPDVRTVEVERVVEKVIEVEKVVTKIEKQAAQVQRVVVYRDRVVTPDGTTREREIETSEAATVQHEQVAQVREQEVERTTERAVEKVVDPRRNWRASALVGVHSIRDRRPVFGLRVERRLIGDVSLGLWGLNSGEVGGSLGFDF
jgi:hypothetical protein